MKPAGAPQALLPRQLWWLIAALLLVSAPHAARLPHWTTLLALALIAWRTHIARAQLRLPPKWMLMIIAAVAMGGTYLQYGRILGRDSGLALLVIMLCLKLLELAALRDAMVLVFLCYFLVVTNFLYSQEILTAVYMLGAVWVITAALIGLQMRGLHPAHREQMRGAAIMLLQALPLMCVLFMLFPRLSAPLWGLPQDARATATGLSDTMAPGTVSNLLLSDAVAFRVDFDGQMPPLNRLYWRGPVMWDFDGRTWSAVRGAAPARRELSAALTPVTYTVTIEPHARRWLFALDLPARAAPRALLTNDFQLLSQTPVTSRLRYSMTSYLSYRDDAEPTPNELRRALALPDDANPRAAELARTMRKAAADERAYARAVLNMFRNQNYYYTTTPPALDHDPVDEFLFSTRAGFCEHYASAFAVLMRAAGIPARIVTGYQGGEFNTIGNYLIVRQADAHAWVEIWLRDAGWTRIDPTGAVSPLRVEAGVAAALPQLELLPLLGANYAWLQQVRMTWDLMQNSWHQTVIGYAQDQQRSLMRRVGMQDTWATMVTLMSVAAAAIVGLLALLLLHRLNAKPADAALAAYMRFCARLARRGIARAPSEGPTAFGERACAARPDLAHAIRNISGIYVRLRYGSRAETQDAERLQRAVRDFRT